MPTSNNLPINLFAQVALLSDEVVADIKEIEGRDIVLHFHYSINPLTSLQEVLQNQLGFKRRSMTLKLHSLF